MIVDIFPVSEPQALVCTEKLHKDETSTSVQTNFASNVALGQEPQLYAVVTYSIAEQLEATGVHLKISSIESVEIILIVGMMSVGGGKGSKIDTIIIGNHYYAL